MTISFSDKVKQWDGEGGWFYVRIPKNYFNDLQEIGKAHGRGFGAIKVSPTIGVTTWETSVFPDAEDKSYILFLKKAVRSAEKLEIGTDVSVDVEIVAL